MASASELPVDGQGKMDVDADVAKEDLEVPEELERLEALETTDVATAITAYVAIGPA